MDNFTLNLYKTFGIRKANKPYSVSTDYNQTFEGFRNPYRAMAHAIKHVDTGSTTPAFIRHPNGGMNRLVIHPKTGNLTLGHVRHGEAENELMRTDDPWKVGDLAQRDTLALERMQEFQNAAKATQLFPALGNRQMDISTWGLHDLPEELHTDYRPSGGRGEHG